MDKKIIFLELNEINFDVVTFYIKRGECLPGFNKLIKQGIVTTKSESEYRNLVKSKIKFLCISLLK